MIETEITINCLSDMSDALSQFSERIAKNALNSALSAGALPIEQEARRFASVAPEPHQMQYGGEYVEVKPGLLISAIRRRRLKKGELASIGAEAGVAIFIGKGTKQKLYPRYWHFIEFGTSRMGAIPFLRPAFDTKKEEALSRFKQKLAQNIAKIQSEVAR